jgi:hypothetical protein
MGPRRPNFSWRHLGMISLACLFIAGWGAFCVRLTTGLLWLFD